ncbi:amino acid adenylation domain-containing protein [Burkholderia sp. FERM BP-3421]|uniref:amino acid adenylation domain-containing protein n=1 Tax=Burkholderia sp. FERM BP-3421 TaxID=1494466 RepID=UPI00236270D2|nr:amino acid adenylation domain-containing protein [Burkholderia sp. FERM BP-3421]WDD93597.1 amino acid adenylation domain-containing protein [Burkholderia sp. FERM BP-3421]
MSPLDVATPPETTEQDVYVFPASFAQERLWFLEQLQPGQAIYNMYDIVPWRGALAWGALERALDALIARHETLRTHFDVEDGHPVQVVASTVTLPLALTDLSALPEAERAAAAQRCAVDEAARPFDLDAAPLLRLRVIRVAPDEHLLVLTIHHIIADGWSMRVLYREFSTLYAGFADGRPATLAPLPIQYADFAVWQRDWLDGDALERQLAFWRGQLDGAPAAPLDLPFDRPRPAAPSYRGALHNFSLDAATTRAVRAFAQREGATPFMVLLAVFKLLLARCSGQSDVVVGTPIANRTRVELEGLIGFFANTLVLRSRVDDTRGFRALVGAVRETTLAAHAHQDLPFERLVEALRPQRALNHNPLFQVMFVLNAFDDRGRPAEDDGHDYREIGIGTAKFDLHVSMIEVGGRLRGIVEYATDLFDAPTIERLARHFTTLLGAALASPDQPMGALPLMDAAEHAAALAAAASPWPAEATPPLVHERVAARAAATPDAIALRQGERALTYGELAHRAERLAHALAARGAGPDAPVGIYIDRSIEQVVAVLAVLQAGACYVPLDPVYPEQRLAAICADARLGLVVTAGAAPAFAGPACVPVDADAPAAREALPAARRDSLAYLLYTSGSTGRPKGVAMPHGPLANLIAWQHAAAPAPARVLQFTSLNFDVSAQEIFSTLGAGATLVLASEEERRDPAALLRRLAADGIERLFAPAAALQALAATAADDPAGPALALREIITAGEQLQVSRPLADFVRRHRIAALSNQYGPTETHVATEWRLAGAPDDWPELPPIGRAIAGARAYLLDRLGALVPDGLPGELCIGGCLPARGYLGQPAQTAERFVADPFSPTPGARMYRTGDLARRRADGALVFLGRLDRQIKVRGVRVEPGEVEAVLRDAPGVREAVVVDGPDPAGGRRLIAYVNAARSQDGAADAAALRRHCRTRLPESMVPALFVPVTAMPLTPSGKIDRAALPDPEPPRAAASSDAPPGTPVEIALAAIWSEVLKVEPVGLHDNFFDLGGHSLLATRVAARIRARLGVELPLRRLFEAPTIAELAVAIIDAELARTAPAELAALLGETAARDFQGDRR